MAPRPSGTLTALRYGRWTDVTSFVDTFTQLRPINATHAVGIARDLNLVDLTAIQTAAGSATAFSASALDQNVRSAMVALEIATVLAGVAVGYQVPLGSIVEEMRARVVAGGVRCPARLERSAASNWPSGSTCSSQ